MTDDLWLFWKRALQAPGLIGTYELPLFVDAPAVGFWRYYDKRLDRWVPVAFFISDDADEVLCCVADGQPVDPLNMGDMWHRCCRHPISWAQYQAAVQGNGFADEPPAAALGHNLSLDLADQMKLEFEAEAEIANDLLAAEITSQDIADKIAIMAARLSKIRQRADDEHTKEKRPHLEAGRAVDDRWRPLREGVSELVTLLKKHLQPWLDNHDSAAGRTGARVSLRTFTVGFITDYDLFIENTKTRADVAQFFETLATKLAKSGTVIGGMEVREQKRAI
jgi:hypothetical protein